MHERKKNDKKDLELTSFSPMVISDSFCTYIFTVIRIVQ